MIEQHPTKFMEYSNLPNLDASTPEVLRNFFNQTTVEAFFEKRSTVVGRKRIITIDKSIVDVIVRDVLMSPSGRQDDSESEEPAGDRSLDLFEPDCATEDDG
ncbi:PiggyBac transposable element-derived protein domain-containing protein [Plasmodiophora brassicae]